LSNKLESTANQDKELNRIKRHLKIKDQELVKAKNDHACVLEEMAKRNETDEKTKKKNGERNDIKDKKIKEFEKENAEMKNDLIELRKRYTQFQMNTTQHKENNEPTT
jgi:hypothetical protein